MDVIFGFFFLHGPRFFKKKTKNKSGAFFLKKIPGILQKISECPRGCKSRLRRRAHQVCVVPYLLTCVCICISLCVCICVQERQGRESQRRWSRIWCLCCALFAFLSCRPSIWYYTESCMYPPPHMTCMYPPPHMTCIWYYTESSEYTK
jgi:hypothetical protein